MLRWLPIATMTLLAALMSGTPSRAAAPYTMSYQGVLTDDAGTLVPDGAYDLQFRIYDVMFGGTALSSENHADVQVVMGGFSVLLGSHGGLVLPYDKPYFLGVSVDGGAELSPRVALSSSPYALSLRFPYAARDSIEASMLMVHNRHNAYPALVANRWFMVGEEGSSNGLLTFSQTGTDRASLVLESTSQGGQIAGFDESVLPINQFQLGPNGDGNGGYLRIAGAGGLVQIDGNHSFSGNPRLLMTGASTIALNAYQTGNASVALPTSAISSSEILDEPGIAQTHLPGNVFPSTLAIGDIVTVQITTPAAGYIVVEAGGQHGLGGNGSASNYADFQIDETSGGVIDNNHFHRSGFLGSSNAPANLTYHPLSQRRTYFKAAAGAYTFRWEAIATNPGGLSNYIWNSTLTATYYPVSYGTVTTSPSLAESGDFDRVRGGRTAGGSQLGGEGTVVDLRELELRVLREQARLAEVEQALRLAQAAAAPIAVPRPAP